MRVGKKIYGQLVDIEGRCVHYHSPLDIVGNLCATCQQIWACHLCHQEATDHPFGTVPVTASYAAVLCGVCGCGMTPATYGAVHACPLCSSPFNPGCRLHWDLYFRP